MEVFNRLGDQNYYYIGCVENRTRGYQQESEQDAQDNELRKKLLRITKHIVSSTQESKQEQDGCSNPLKKTQWLPYEDKDLEETYDLFTMLNTMEEKLAQLFFYVPDCCLDIEDFISDVYCLEETYGLGGVLLSCSLEQQSDFIRRFNQSKHIPLLAGAPVSQSLRFYLSHKEQSLIEGGDAYGIGEDLGGLLQQMGVPLSIIFQDIICMDIESYSQLIQGLKCAGNIQGHLYRFNHTHSTSNFQPISLRYSLANTIRGLEMNVDFSSLKFTNCSILANPENTIKSLNCGLECFTCSNVGELKEGITILRELISAGHVSPAIINKGVMKILMLKRRLGLT